jgi:metallo-beta-lactamase family protein
MRPSGLLRAILWPAPLAWQKQTSAKRTFLVHGEEDAMRQFAVRLADTRVEMPGPNQEFVL